MASDIIASRTVIKFCPSSFGICSMGWRMAFVSYFRKDNDDVSDKVDHDNNDECRFVVPRVV